MGDMRKLTVTSCEEVYSGTNNKGNPYTIYKVSALNEAGQPAEPPVGQLNSFDDLTPLLHQLIEYEVTVKEPKPGKEKYGPSYTLKPPKEHRRSSSQGLADLTARVDAHDERLEWLVGELRRLQAATGQPQSPGQQISEQTRNPQGAPPAFGPAGAPPATDVPADAPLPLPAPPGATDDIPF